MGRGVVDPMTEFAVTCLASDDPLSLNALVRDMIRRWPDAPALSIVFAITSAASTLEDMMDGEVSVASAQRGYKLAALLAADVFAVEAMGQTPAKGHDVMHFWRRVDPFFLEL